MRIAKRTYRNPVYRGDYPDPSLIRVGDHDFWATTTSTEWAPYFPLLHSRDLVHWEEIDAVFRERPSWSRGSFWAPEISFYNGRYIVYYVAQHESGPLTVAVASASRPEGPYTDHGPLVGQSSGSIDPTPVTGEDDRRYLIWKEDGNAFNLPTTLWIQPLSDDGLRLVGEATPILRNDCEWEGNVVEAPSVIRRGDWFYLFYSGNACCGKHCKYAVGVARARSVLGPWEKFSGNPIIATNNAWRCPGHGSIVDTSDGRTFYMYHAYSREDSVYVGRQVLIDEVRWDNEWPVVNNGAGPSSVAPRPFARTRQRTTKKTMWQWPQGRTPRVSFRHGLRGRGIVLSCDADGPASDDVLSSVIARPTDSSEYVAETGIALSSLAPGVQASLVAYGDAENAVGVGVRDNEIVVFRRGRGAHRTVARATLGKRRTLRLRVHVTKGYEYRFSFSYDGRIWTPLGATVRAPHLTPWDRGIRIALTAGGGTEASVRFKWFIVTQPKMHSIPSYSKKLERMASAMFSVMP